jgi:hypothetical protein
MSGRLYLLHRLALFIGKLLGGVHRFCCAAYSAFSELYDDFTSFPIA